MKSNKWKFSPELERAQYRPSYPLGKIVLFFVALAAGCVLSFLLFLRPSYSEGEKRQLATFPAFSVKTLLSGQYFEEIGLWYADTFPFREEMVSANAHVQSLYGLRGNVVYTDGNDQFDDDAIPDTPMRTENITTGTTVTLPPYQTTTTTTTTTTTAATTTTTTTDTTTSTSTTTTTTATTNGTTVPDTGMEPQTLGSVLVAGNSGYEYYSFSQKAADMYVDTINRAAASLDGDATVYDILVPLAMDIVLDDATRAAVRSADQKKAIDYIYGSLDPRVRPVDAYSALRAHREEYLYFRTDHHWTATGAYYAYEAFAKKKGVAFPALGDYQTMHFEGYLGTLYSKTGKVAALGNTPDTVTAFLPLYPTTMRYTDIKGKTYDWAVVKDVSDWKKSSLYNTFIGGDNPFTVIKNTALSDGSSCVVVKESFGNAFVPFLVSNYETIYVIDYRYYNGDVTAFVRENDVEDVIFINNMSATRSTKLMEQLEKRIK